MRKIITPNQIIGDAPLNFGNLLCDIYTLFVKYGKAYGNEDGRTVFFAHSFQLNLWLLIQFDSFLEVFASNSNRVSSHAQLSSENASQFVSQYDTINRANYCTRAMFDVEFFLKSIVKELKRNPDVGYRALTKKLKDELKLSDYQCDILNLPAVTRNTLHNNGYHREKDWEVVIGRRKYKFEKDKKVRFAGWDNLYIMFDELLDVLEVIVESQKLKSLANIPHTSMTYQDTQ